MKKILIVDDEENIRLLYKEELTDEGYIIETADSVNNAIKKIEDFNPDLIILDIKMPGVDGLEGLKKFKELFKDIPVILCSAYESYKQNFITWSAEEYVVKSSDLTELKEKIRKILVLWMGKAEGVS